MIVLTPRQLNVAWWSACDADIDTKVGTAQCQEVRLAILPESDHESYRQCYAVAFAAIGEGHGIHMATTKAENVLRELAVVAGIG